MTLLEMLVLLFIVGVGVVGGFEGYKLIGFLGAALGFVGGAFCVVFFVLGISRFSDWISPPFPLCLCGERDFYAVQSMSDKEGMYVGSKFLCRVCGRKYVVCRPNFDLLKQSGEAEPYMQIATFGGWKLVGDLKELKKLR